MTARNAAPLFIALSLSVALAAGCGGAATSRQPGSGSSPGSGSGSSSGTDPGAGAREARSGLSRDTAPGAPAADVASVVAGNNAFAFQLHQRLVEPGANMMTSPYSVSTALAMLWPGARGDTATQLANALHFTLPAPQFHQAFNALDLELARPSCAGIRNPPTLHLTNTAWLQDGLPLVPAYLDTLAVNYGAGVSLLDFVGDPEGAQRTINDAVARSTEQRIKDLLPEKSIDETVRFVLTNTVYFNAEWDSPFDPSETGPRPFRLEGGGEITVPFMHRGDVQTRRTVQPGYDAVELRYHCAPLAMTLIAPKAGTFEAFERAFDVAALAGVDAAMEEGFVSLSMPLFRFRWGTTSLVPALKALGMNDAFDEQRADLTGLTALRPLFLLDVMQQTFVAVDERGTEAAAATAGIGGSTGGKGEWLRVSLDRPFLFLVRNTTTGQILFLGRVMDPR